MSRVLHLPCQGCHKENVGTCQWASLCAVSYCFANTSSCSLCIETFLSKDALFCSILWAKFVESETPHCLHWKVKLFPHSTLKVSSILEQHGQLSHCIVSVHKSQFLANIVHGLQRHWFLQVRIPRVELPLSWSTALLRETTCITHEVVCPVFVLENQAMILTTRTATPVNDL